MANPFLLALSSAILLIILLASIPFITLIFRPLSAGYSEIQRRAVRNVLVWLWSWCVVPPVRESSVRDITPSGLLPFVHLRYVSSHVSFCSASQAPLPTDPHIIHGALLRSTYASLGSIVLIALMMACVRLLALLPACSSTLVSATYDRRWYGSWLLGKRDHVALVYTGVTDNPFLPSARRARALTTAVESAGAACFRRKYKSECTMIQARGVVIF